MQKPSSYWTSCRKEGKGKEGKEEKRNGGKRKQSPHSLSQKMKTIETWGIAFQSALHARALLKMQSMPFSFSCSGETETQ